MPALRTPRSLSLLLCMAGLLLALLWLGSLDRYLAARYHWNLETLSASPVGLLSRLRERLQDELDGQLPAGLVGSLSMGKGRWKAPPAPTPWRELPAPPAAGEYLRDLRQLKLRPGPQRILFAGDSLMQGVAPLVMRELARQHPDWEMSDLSRQSTGLTVRRHFDWPQRIAQEIEARQLTLVVVFLGPNDPWDLVVEGQRERFPSTGWAWRYAQRVDEIQAAAARRQVRVLWLGLPSMPEGRLREGALIQNRVFHERAKAWRSDYLATEPLVGLLSEPPRRHGRDAQGQPVALRAEDGIHFTPTALRRIRDALLAHIEQARVP